MLDQVKKTVIVFAHKGQPVDHQRSRKVRHQIGFKQGLNLAKVVFWQFPGQCHVEPKLVHHVWIAPVAQIGLLLG